MLNVSKTKFMPISRTLQQCNHPSIFLDTTPLEQVPHFKYLGVRISARGLNTFLLYLVRLEFIFRAFSPYCSSQAIISLYKAQVLPVLDYGCIVWDPHLKKDCLLIENVQLFATRMATKSWRANASTLNETLNLPPVASRRAYISKYFMPSSF